MDQEREQAVWQRVRAPGVLRAEEAVLPERLEALLLEQQASAASLRALARRLQGPPRAALSRAAARLEAQARELNTLHYLLTGRSLRLRPPIRPQNAPVPEALRELCLRLRRTAQAFEALQTEFAEYAADFGRCANETRSESQALLRLLQTQMRPGL